MINILYLSCCFAPSHDEELLRSGRRLFNPPIQKFHRLLTKGVAAQDQAEITLLSTLPAADGRRRQPLREEKNDGIRYIYVGYWNFPGLKGATVFLGALRQIIKWRLSAPRHTQTVICDVLNTTWALLALISGALLRIRKLTIVTDLPNMLELLDSRSSKSPKQRLARWLSGRIITRFDGYILLTEQMSEVVNPRQRPYVVIEGVSELDATATAAPPARIPAAPPFVMYAGALHARFGIRELVDGFRRAADLGWELHLYGHGDMEDEINSRACREDSRIKFFGTVSNSKIVAEAKKASLLINPRSGEGEYTRYSFPSKNMEYMSSGTPLLAARLPGIPDEYFNYIYVLDDPSADGICRKLREIAAIPEAERARKGETAREYVAREKGYAGQGAKLVEFIKNM